PAGRIACVPGDAIDPLASTCVTSNRPLGALFQSDTTVRIHSPPLSSVTPRLANSRPGESTDAGTETPVAPQWPTSAQARRATPASGSAIARDTSPRRGAASQCRLGLLIASLLRPLQGHGLE